MQGRPLQRTGIENHAWRAAQIILETLRTDRFEESVAEYRAALRLKPRSPSAHYNLGLALQRLGRNPEAIAEFDLAISLPALFAGSALGVIAFHRVNETVFRKTVLVLLLLSGISLI